MIKIGVRLLAAVLTFSLSVGAVALTSFLIIDDKSVAAYAPPKIAEPINLLGYPEDSEYTERVDALKAGEFLLIGHGCGDGFADGYVTQHRVRLSYGLQMFHSRKLATSKFSRELRMASSIIEGPDDIIRNEQHATRYFVVSKAGVRPNFSIIWISKNSKGYWAIDGPDEDTTRLLENYLLNNGAF